MDEKRFNELRDLKRRGEVRNFNALAELGEFANLLCERLDASESKLSACAEDRDRRAERAEAAESKLVSAQEMLGKFVASSIGRSGDGWGSCLWCDTAWTPGGPEMHDKNGCIVTDARKLLEPPK